MHVLTDRGVVLHVEHALVSVAAAAHDGSMAGSDLGGGRIGMMRGGIETMGLRGIDGAF
jgi:hypothetical protein